MVSLVSRLYLTSWNRLCGTEETWDIVMGLYTACYYTNLIAFQRQTWILLLKKNADITKECEREEWHNSWQQPFIYSISLPCIPSEKASTSEIWYRGPSFHQCISGMGLQRGAWTMITMAPANMPTHPSQNRTSSTHRVRTHLQAQYIKKKEKKMWPHH